TLRRIHSVDHPSVSPGPKKHVAALEPLAVEYDHHLSVRPLDRVVGPFVPDQDLPAAVLTFWDLAGELEVFERVVLHVHGEVILLWIRRDAFGDRPRNSHPVLLEPKVPVQPARVVLLDHKPRRLGLLAGDL